MPKLNLIQNIEVLISHSDIYEASRTIDDILVAPISYDFLCLLSILSFAKDEEKRFHAWSQENLPVARKKSETPTAKKYAVFGRLQIFECWKQLLMRASALQVAGQSRTEMVGVLHELFTKINDQESENDIDQYLAKSSIHYARDDSVYKLYRAQKIFLDGKHVMPHVAAFEEKNNFSVKMYLRVIFAILNRCHVMRNVEFFDPESIDDWLIDISQISLDLKIDLVILKRIVSELSFGFSGGFALVGEERHDFGFELFRNRPFLQVSDVHFLPIEGKIVEELLFDNLLHRLYQAADVGAKFYQDLGRDFESYVQALIERFCSTRSAISYEYIPEFKYGKSNSLSPDAMVICEAEKTVVAFEVKSARYLDSILADEEIPQIVEESFEKLRFKPWEQVYGAVERIVREKRHDKLTEGLSYLFVSVTMNEIPHSVQDYKIDIQGVDRSCCFYSFGVHSLEVLLGAANASKDLSLYDILRNAFNLRHEISNRTVFIRILRGEKNGSEFSQNIRLEAINRVIFS